MTIDDKIAIIDLNVESVRQNQAEFDTILAKVKSRIIKLPTPLELLRMCTLTREDSRTVQLNELLRAEVNDEIIEQINSLV